MNKAIKKCPCCKNQVPVHCQQCGCHLEKAISDLLPCKLCKSEARFCSFRSNKMLTTCTITYYVQCMSCHIRTKDYDNDTYIHEDAINSWNKTHK